MTGWMFLRLRDTDVARNDGHGDGAAGCTDHEDSSTSEVINDEEDPEQGANCLDDAEHAGSEEACVEASNADSLCSKSALGGMAIHGVQQTLKIWRQMLAHSSVRNRERKSKLTVGL